MTRLHQVLPVEKTARNDAFKALTTAHREVQRTAQISGISKTYQRKDEDGDEYPPQSTKVQVKTRDIIASLTSAVVRSLDLAATREWGNTAAFADIVVDGTVLVEKAPVGFLLFLGKHLENIRTFIEKLPTLDPAESWTWDGNEGVWRTHPVETVKTKKIMKALALTPTTKEHPGTAQAYTDDVVEGTWTTIKFSGAMKATQVAELLARVSRLQDAVKVAREEANSVTIVDHAVGQSIFDYLFAE